MVMAGLVPATPINAARPCRGNRGRRAKPGDDGGAGLRIEALVRTLYSAGSFAGSDAGTTSFTAPRQPEWVRSNTTPSGPLNFTS